MNFTRYSSSQALSAATYHQEDFFEEALAQALEHLDPQQAVDATYAYRLPQQVAVECRRLAGTRGQAWPSAGSAGMSIMSTALVDLLSPTPAPGHSVLDNALKHTDRIFVDALSEAGMSGRIVALLQNWISVHQQARELHHQNTVARLLGEFEDRLSHGHAAPEPAPEVGLGDPMDSLGAKEMGAQLGAVSDETVRLRERGGELFSVMPVGRKRGREYPVFQSWVGITGAPLKQVLVALTGLSTTDMHGFFAGVSEFLAGLTPVEAMMGALVQQRPLSPEAQELLRATKSDRMGAVLQAARSLVALRAV